MKIPHDKMAEIEAAVLDSLCSPAYRNDEYFAAFLKKCVGQFVMLADNQKEARKQVSQICALISKEMWDLYVN